LARVILMLGPRPSRIRGFLVVVVTILGAAGVALTALGIGPMGWQLIIPGFALLLISIPTVFVLRRPQIEEAAKAAGRARVVSPRRDSDWRLGSRD
jgi:hypothetical protein